MRALWAVDSGAVDCVQVTVTAETREEAERLARSAVERRLAACAQVVGPIASTYWWNGAVDTAAEWQCLLKTTAARFEELRAHVEAEHSYDTPEIIATPIVAGSPAYLAWIAEETRPR
jgi:periplasmic divalent cation tolerance protein